MSLNTDAYLYEALLSDSFVNVSTQPAINGQGCLYENDVTSTCSLMEHSNPFPASAPIPIPCASSSNNHYDLNNNAHQLSVTSPYSALLSPASSMNDLCYSPLRSDMGMYQALFLLNWFYHIAEPCFIRRFPVCPAILVLSIILWIHFLLWYELILPTTGSAR